MGLAELLVARRRRRAARRAPEGALRTYLETPLPGPATPLNELPLLAVDLETTGFDPRRHRALSVGFVPVDGGGIALGGAEAVLLRPEPGRGLDDEGVGQSATVHGITDDAVATGESVEAVLDQIFSALKGRILLAHYSPIETDFLSVLCQTTYGVRPPLQVIDTLELQRRVVVGGPENEFRSAPDPEELRLGAARQRYGLPRYRAHNALGDALACAELYLAQVSELAERGVRELGDLPTP